jgi:hypothetical protein
MESLPEKEQIRAYLANWKVVTEESERLRAAALRALTEERAAEQFNELDCDPSLVWTPPSAISPAG